MKKKILLLLFMIFLLSGCTVDYQITIDEKGKVEEDARAMEDKEFFNDYNKSSVGRVVAFLIEPYADILNENNYNTESIINKNNGGVTLSNKYNNIEEYTKKTILLSQFTDDVSYEKNGSKVTLKAKGKLSGSEQNQEVFPIEKATVIIELPYKVVEHNATKVAGKKYIWELKSEEEKEIKIVYDENKIVKDSNNIVLYVIIGIVIVIVIGIIAVANIRAKREEINKI